MSINKIETIGHAVAFPYEPEKVNLGTQGLTKREYFAAMAMQGMLSNPHLSNILTPHIPPEEQADFICLCATEQADALIEALNKKEVSHG